MGFRAGVRVFACAVIAVSLWAAPAQAVGPFQRGFTVMGWTAGSYLTPRSDRNITRLADDGSSHMAVFTQWFMDSPTSSTVAPDAEQTASDDAILHALATARAAGMATVLKPQIAIRTGNWIGYAHPADLESFWSSYRTMMLHYARLAEKGGASILVVGTEMRTLSSDEGRWRDLIAAVREQFHGQLTYAANYDEFQQIRFWDALDYIGIDAYFGLASPDNPAPSADALASAWNDRGYLARIAALSRSTGRQVLFTEIGYRGIRPTAVEPNRWDVDGEIDLDAQANAYEAFYRAVADQPWMAGVYWWGVDVDSWWVKGYTPIGKPAEAVMSAWNQRLGADTAPPPAADPPTPAASATSAPTPQPEPVLTDVPAVSATAGTPAAVQLAPQKAAPLATTTTRHRTTIYVTVQAKRLTGAVAPYSATCNGKVRLRMRVRRGSKWRHLPSPAPLRLSAKGTFSLRMPAGPLRVDALYASSCSKASSGWVGSRS